MAFSIAIHGGAGTILRSTMTPELQQNYEDALSDALDKGVAILKHGGTAIDAVAAAVMSLENCPLFNAGKGSVQSHDGSYQMDAALMSGDTLEAGAVAGVSGVKNPILLARSIMENSEHVMLSGAGALQFAKEQHLETEPDDYFYNEFRHQQYLEALKEDRVQLDHSDKKFGTVGAVARDEKGNLAAATSTGGMTNKKYGRIGDTPLIGAGTYACNETCAVSCTGHGELFMRTVVAHDISCLMAYRSLTLKDAADILVHQKLVKIGGEGGLIAVDAQGNITMPFNSEGMYRASYSLIGLKEVLIYKEGESGQ